MKKIISAILVFALCLSLAACGKSEAVKNVEAMIDALGEITAESIDAIRAAEDAYAALTPEEQEQVKNYETLTATRDRYYELVLAGEWCYSKVYLYELENEYDRVSFKLNTDMTATDMIGTVQEFEGQWSVSDCRLTISGEGNVIYNTYDVVEEDGKIRLTFPDIGMEWIRREELLDLLDDAFLIVDLAEVDLTEYFGLQILDYESTDDWDDPTGDHTIRAIVTNRLYDQGWVYLKSSDDLALEILYPQFQAHTVYEDGHTWNRTTEAGSHTFTWCPFDFAAGLWIDSYSTDSMGTHDLTADQLSFGRAKGTIVFINSEYVSEIRPSEDGYSRVLITAFTEDQEYYSGSWYHGINY